mmetsp:Transcript_37818/g.61273  ORF Transcript_37818/g.61273 Transcript_37818/m.61273 type:complete len:804 (-) Transcript_37818:1040-3451(-)
MTAEHLKTAVTHQNVRLELLCRLRLFSGALKSWEEAIKAYDGLRGLIGRCRQALDDWSRHGKRTGVLIALEVMAHVTTDPDQSSARRVWSLSQVKGIDCVYHSVQSSDWARTQSQSFESLLNMRRTQTLKALDDALKTLHSCIPCHVKNLGMPPAQCNVCKKSDLVHGTEKGAEAFKKRIALLTALHAIRPSPEELLKEFEPVCLPMVDVEALTQLKDSVIGIECAALRAVKERRQLRDTRFKNFDDPHLNELVRLMFTLEISDADRGGFGAIEGSEGMPEATFKIGEAFQWEKYAALQYNEQAVMPQEEQMQWPPYYIYTQCGFQAISALMTFKKFESPPINREELPPALLVTLLEKFIVARLVCGTCLDNLVMPGLLARANLTPSYRRKACASFVLLNPPRRLGFNALCSHVVFMLLKFMEYKDKLICYLTFFKLQPFEAHLFVLRTWALIISIALNRLDDMIFANEVVNRLTKLFPTFGSCPFFKQYGDLPYVIRDFQRKHLNKSKITRADIESSSVEFFKKSGDPLILIVREPSKRSPPNFTRSFRKVMAIRDGKLLLDQCFSKSVVVTNEPPAPIPIPTVATDDSILSNTAPLKEVEAPKESEESEQDLAETEKAPETANDVIVIPLAERVRSGLQTWLERVRNTLKERAVQRSPAELFEAQGRTILSEMGASDEYQEAYVANAFEVMSKIDGWARDLEASLKELRNTQGRLLSVKKPDERIENMLDDVIQFAATLVDAVEELADRKRSLDAANDKHRGGFNVEALNDFFKEVDGFGESCDGLSEHASDLNERAKSLL